MRVTIQIILTSVVLLLAGAGTSLAGDVVLIVNKSANVAALSRQDVENIFLGKKTRWESGGAIRLAILGETNAEFLKRIIDKSPSQLSNLWKKLVFTGQGTMPKIFQTEDEIIRYVTETPGACGYAVSGRGGGQVQEVAVP